MGKLTCISLAVLFIHAVGSQNVDNVSFGGGDEQAPVEGNADPNVDTRLSEDDAKTRFFLTGLDLNTFAGNVAASAVGTVVGNVGTNLAGNYLSGCSNRGKRSVLMHKLEKRQALDSVNLEANEKTGNADSEPEVATRLFCPQDFLNPGGNNNNGQSYCDRCNCNDWNCRQDCRKCGNYGWSNTGSSNSGWSNNNSGCRHNNCGSNNNNAGWSNSGSNNNNAGWGNNNNGWSNNNNNNVNCYSCSCSYSSCKNKCSKCRNNYNNYNNNNQWSSNSGYRNSQTVNGRTAADSEEAPEVVTVTSAEPITEIAQEAVVFER